MSSPAIPNLSDAQLGEMLGLLEDSDSVELNLTVSDSDHRSAAAELGLDPLDAENRQVFFFGTPDLALDGRGTREFFAGTLTEHDGPILGSQPVGAPPSASQRTFARSS